MLLYLGTFGSLMRLRIDADRLATSTITSCDPFEWLLSVPDLGPEVERLGQDWFPHSAHPLTSLDRLAEKAPPGAGGIVFLLPRWKNGMTPVGRFELRSTAAGLPRDRASEARAVLEGIGYAIRALALSVDAPILAGGGGARSNQWLSCLADVLGQPIHVRDASWEAVGAATIAAQAHWGSRFPERPLRSFWPSHRYNGVVIALNHERSKEIYREQAWL
jgi:sugar (pentulose or hexulose) kinase